MKVCFETFGCRLNKAEALQMEADYLANGWELTKEHADADLFVVRGCSVTSRAQRDCEKLIERLKRHHPTAKFRICGCIKAPSSIIQPPAPRAPKEPTVPVRTARAYLKAQDGCAGQCTFCIVPKFRGASKSEPWNETLDRARRFIDAGYREIVLTGCNLSLYASEGHRLPELVAALADLSADCRVRIGSVEPGACAIETIHAMAEKPNVCRFLHLPVQSGSNRTLLAMRRPYAVKDVDAAVELATKLMPGIGLGCDLIAGFPGETDLDFTATRGLLKRLAFSNAHVFPYSKRPGTLAAGFPTQLTKEVRNARAHELNKVIRNQRAHFASTFIGKTVEYIVENETNYSGWSGEYLPCIPIAGRPERKSLARLFVMKTKGENLIGRIQK